MIKKTKEDRKNVWIVAGRDQFAKSGIEGINVDILSSEVGVARTSFYHFFKSKDQFLKEVVDFWIEDGTMRLIKIFKRTGNPRERLQKIYRLALKNSINDQFSSQLRNAALHSKFLKKKLEETEAVRIKFLSQLFKDYGFDTTKSRERALIAYQLFLGFLEFYKSTGYKDTEIRRFGKLAVSVLLV